MQSVNRYDIAGRLVNLTHNGSYWTLAAYTYTLDAVGNRLAVTERVLPPTPFNYLPVILKDFAGGGEQMLPGEQSSPFASPLATPPPFDSPLLPTSNLPPHSAAAPMFDPSLLIIAPIALAAVVASRKGRKWALLVAVLTGALVVVGQTHTRASGAIPAPMPFLSPQSPPPGCTLPTALGDTRVISYTYDPLYRLNQAAYSSGECYQYAYDRVGNRTALTTTVSVIAYQYDPANRLSSVNGQTYTWDNNGNLINDGNALYRYDRANRLISTTLNSTTSLFNYNGDGVRLKQVVASTVTTYTQDVAAPLPVVLQSKTGVTTTKYLYSMGTRPVAQNATAWEYLLPDALGSVRQIANVNGYIIRTQDYEPYGSLLNGSGSGQSVYGFTGEERDATGLLFLRARYMQPSLGIFLSRDPWSGDVMQPGSMNGFSYGLGSPVRYTDPSGHCVLVGKNDDVCIAYSGETPLRIIKGGSEFVNFTEMGLASTVLFGAPTSLPGCSPFYNLAMIPARGGPPPYYLKPLHMAGPGPFAEGIGNYTRLFAVWLNDLIGNAGSAGTTATVPEVNAIPQGATADIGATQGRAKAAELGLEVVDWPGASLGSSRQGFDDVLRAANGDLVIAEYKGYTTRYGGYLAGDQMSGRWLRSNIQDLIRVGDPMGYQLQTALQEGRLSGIVFRTQIISGVPQPTQIFKIFWY
jgi:RHS repeat-associated protein